MKKVFPNVCLCLSLVVLMSAAAFGQSPTPTPNEADDVVKITTKLVQVDVTVTDKKGAQVQGLKADDFELTQDGKPQKITGFTYVTVDPLAVTTRIEQPKGQKAGNDVPVPVRSIPNGGRRIIALMVDDGSCGASVWGINSSRDAVVRFINEQMLPTDLVAIYRTRAGSSTFQQYTSDKTQLLAAANKIKWYPAQGSCGTPDGAFTEAVKANTITTGTGNATIENDMEKKIREHNEDAIRNNQVVGTLGVIRYLIRGLEAAPGRKIVFFMSDGLEFRNRQNEFLSATEALRDVTDAANRAGVVFDTFDLRGANVPGMIESRDDITGISTAAGVNATSGISNARIADAVRGQDGLKTLAYDTGGDIFQGPGRLDKPMGEILRRETGYYLLAYEPNEETFKNKKFNKIEVKVKIPDFKVASRAGFIGTPDETAVKPKRRTADSDLYEAIAAPLARAGLNVRLTAYFANTPAGGNFVRSTFHLEGGEITFADDTNGLKKLVLDVVAVTLDAKNNVIDEFTRTHTVRFDAATAELIRKRGLIYAADVPVKNPGTYNFRVAVRDGNSKVLGSASDVVMIPDLKRSPLMVSGLTITGLDGTGKVPQIVAPTAETALSLPPSGEVPAIRKFTAGATMAYLYSIYNARTEAATGKPKLTVKANLFQNGKLIVDGKPQPVELDAQQDWSHISNYAYIQLAKEAEPGEYALQIVITDAAAGGVSSSEWIDFEIVP